MKNRYYFYAFFFIAILTVLFSNKTLGESDLPNNPYAWRSIYRINNFVTRYENKEVICYQYRALHASGLSCNLKKEKENGKQKIKRSCSRDL